MSYLLDQVRGHLGLPPEGTPPPADWEATLAEAEREGLGPLVAWRLCQEPGAPEEARQVLLAAFGWSARVGQVLATVGERLEEAGRTVLVLKGGALVRTVYAGFPALRPLCDLDFFVRAGDEEAVRRAAAGPGLAVPVDLHRSLVSADRIPTRARAFRFPEEELWAESVPLPGGPASLRMLGPRHLVPSLAVHALKHGYSRLSWLLDLALLVPGEDPGLLLEGARRSGSERPLACALWLLESLFGMGTPLSEALPPLHPVELAVLRRVARRRHAAFLGELLVGLSVPGRLGLLRHLGATLFPPRAVLRGLFPGAPDWQLPLLRLLGLARLAWGASTAPPR